MSDIIIIDDEISMCEGCRQTLEGEGYDVKIANDGTRGLEMIEKFHPHIAIVDLKMPGISGEEVLSGISRIDSSILPIVITGYGTIDSAVGSMKLGAFDFLTKPFDPDKLIESVRKAAEKINLKTKDAGKAAEHTHEKAEVNKQNVLLKGLENLGDYYSLGFKKQDYLAEIKELENDAEELGKNRLGKKEDILFDIVDQLSVVDDIIEKHEYKKNALIQILLDIQMKLKWLPEHVLKWTSGRLGVPLSRLYTIANFYEAFSLVPQGAYTVQVCTGTACHVRGASGLISKVSSLLGIQPGETDSKQLFSFKTVHCLGCCAMAPVVKIDDKYYNDPSLKELKKILNSYEEKEKATCQN